MNESQQLRESMWDLVYGLLSEEESRSLIVRVKSDPQAARLYSEVRLQADLVSQAAKVEDSSLVFDAALVNSTSQAAVSPKAAAPQTPPKSAAASRAHYRVETWLAAGGATALALLLSVGALWPRANEAAIARNLVAIDLLTEPSMPAGLTQQVALRTYFVSSRGEPSESTSAEVDLQLLDSGGQELLRKTVKTDDKGSANVDLPGDLLEPGVRLNLVKSEPAAMRNKAKAVVNAALPVQPEPQMAYFLVSEPTVEAGKAVDVSLWNFAAFSAKPSTAETTRAAIETVEGIQVQEPASAAEARKGLVNAKLEVPQKTEAGAVVAGLAENSRQQFGGQVPAVSRSEALRETPPQPAATAPAAPPPGERLATVRLHQAERRQAATQQLVEQNSARRLGQQSQANKNSQSLARSADVAGAKLADNREQVTTIAAGQPIKLTLPNSLTGKAVVATAVCRGIQVATAVLDGSSQSPSAGRSNQVQQDSEQITLELPPEADGLIEVSLFDRSSGEPALVEQRFLYREPLRQLQIELANSKDRFAPGEQVQLDFRVTDEKGNPAADARLGVRVWNEQVVEQSAEQPVLLADAFRNGVVESQAQFGVEQQSALGQANSFQRYAAPRLDQQIAQLGVVDQVRKRALAEEEKIAAKEQQQSTPANPNDPARLALEAKPAEPIAERATTESLDRAASLGYDTLEAATLPLAPSEIIELASNRDVVQAEIQAATSSAEGNRQRAMWAIGAMVVVIGVVLLVLVALAAALRMTASLRTLTPAAIAALASALIGLSWIGWLPQGQRTTSAVATKSAPSASGYTDFTEAAPAATTTPDFGIPPAAASVVLADETQATLAASKEADKRDLDRSAGAPPVASPLADRLAPAQPAVPTSPAAGSEGRAVLTDLKQSTDERAAGLAEAGQRADDIGKSLARSPALGRPASGPAESKGATPLAAGGVPAASAPRKSVALSPAPGAGGFARGLQPTTQALPGLSAADAPAANRPSTSGGESQAPAALYFNPQLQTDADGRASIQFVMPSVQSEYRLMIDALGNGRIGSRQEQLIIQSPPAAK